MTGELSGKVALVTGAARGVGAASARAIAQKGADVAISYLDTNALGGHGDAAALAQSLAAELRDKGVRAIAYAADQADPDQVKNLVGAVVRDFGKLDILVNNAGVTVHGTIGDPDANLAALDRQLAINLGGLISLIRAAAPVISNGGRIIAIGSGMASRPGFPGFADYAASKAGVAAYCKGAAHDLADRGINVNVIQPGVIDTDMNPADGSYASTFLSKFLIKRFGRAEEIADGVAFLAGPHATYITGSTIDIDGGYSA